MRSRARNQGGFSLVEVVLALAIVIFCLVSVLGLLAVGANSSHTSIEQTNLGNVLTAIATDLETTPNPPGISSGTPSPRGTAQTSPIFQIHLPATGSAQSASTSPNDTIYLGQDGEVASSASTARYRLSVWTSEPGANQQEILVRLVLSWPAAAAYSTAAGSVEEVVALNRTP